MQLSADAEARCAPWLSALQRALAGEPPPSRWPTGEQALELGWQLKHLAQAAWSQEPPRAQLHARALALLAAQPGQPALLQPLAAWAEGIAQLAGGRCEVALEQLARAAQGFAAQQQPFYAAQARLPRTVALGMLGRPAEALGEAQALLQEFTSLGDERAAAKLELNIGTLLARGEQAAEACAHYRRAGVRFARLGDTEHSVMADIGLANALTQRSELDEASFVNERARRRARSQGGLPVLEAHAEAGIGRIALQRGDPAGALPHLARARELLAQAGAAPQRLLEADEALADAQAALGLWPEARAVFGRLAASATQLGARREAQRAQLRAARLALREGDAPAAVASLADLPLDTGLQPAAALVRAEACLLQGDSAGALQQARAGLKGYQDLGLPAGVLEAELLLAKAEDAEQRPVDWDALVAACASVPLLQARAQLGRAQARLRSGLLREACADLDAALDWGAAQRAALLLDELRCAAGRELDAAAALRLSLARRLGDSDEALFQLGERLQGRALRLDDGPLMPHLPPLPARDRWLQAHQKSEAARRSGDTGQLQRLLDEQHTLEAEWLEQWRRGALAQGGALPAEPAAPDGEALDHLLAEGEAWLQWQLDEATGEAWALLRWQGGWQRFVLPLAPLREALHAVCFQFEALRAGPAVWQPHAAELKRRALLRLRQLHKALWAPLAPALQGCRSLVLVPRGLLHAVPWAALHDGTAFLCERLPLRLAAGAASWRAACARPALPAAPLALLGQGDAQLPAVEAELAALATLRPDARRWPATRDGLAAAAAEAGLLHLAAHAQLRDDNPAFSQLQLADGPLPAHEIGLLRLRPGSTVVLAACDAARGLRAAGDEQLSLVRAFWLAGARAVLAAPWAVDDAASAAWMSWLHAGLAAGLGLAEATRAAQQRAAVDGWHPALWGGWAVQGPG